MKPRILDRYVALSYLALYAACLVAFTIIYVLVDSVAQATAIAEKTEGFSEFIQAWYRFYWAQVAILFTRVLGALSIVAGAAFTVTLFHRANELTPVLAAGVSLRRLLAPILALSLLACGGQALVQEVWIPLKSHQIREATTVGRGGGVLRNVHHFDPRNRILVILRAFQPKKLRGEGFLIVPLVGREGRRLLVDARQARWAESDGKRGEWILEDGFTQEYDEQGNIIPVPLAAAAGQTADQPQGQCLVSSFSTKKLSEIIEFDLLPADLEARQSQEPYLWLSALWEKAKRSPESARWRVRLYSRLADPLHGFILVLLCIPTIMARGSRNIFLSAIATVVLSSLYFVAYSLFLNIGNRGGIPPGLAVGLAPLFFGALGVTLYWQMDRRLA